MSNSRKPFVQIFHLVTQHWFLCGLMLVIPAGILLGTSETAREMADSLRKIPGTLLTAVILFLMSITLDSSRLVASVRSPKAVLLATLINQLIMPLMAMPILPLISSPDLRLGLLIASIVPCTMAAASVWTRMANGNDAVSLLVTLLTNSLCFLVIPIWLSFAVSGQQLNSVAETLAFTPMAARLVKGAVLPVFFGQLVRLIPHIRSEVDRRKKVYSNSAQIILLFIVYMSALTGGTQFSEDAKPPDVSVFLTVLLACNALHICGMIVCSLACYFFSIRPEDKIAVIFAGSQKTLPVGVAVAQASGVPLAIVPMLMFHASQLFVDTWVAARIALPRTSDRTDAGETKNCSEQQS
ncbi:MAG: bile acid:sodium symporter [Planctomycetaceae bacterium]